MQSSGMSCRENAKVCLAVTNDCLKMNRTKILVPRMRRSASSRCAADPGPTREFACTVGPDQRRVISCRAASGTRKVDSRGARPHAAGAAVPSSLH